MRSLDFAPYFAPNQPGVNATPALTQALADAAAQDAQEIYFCGGAWTFLTPIPPIRGIRLAGKNASATSLRIKHTGNGLYFDGGNGKMCGGAHDLSIWAAAGGAGNVGLYLGASATMSPDFADFSNVIVTAIPGSNWNYGLHINGVERTSPQGVRDIQFDHCEFFAALYYAMYVRSAVGLVFDGLGCFPAGGNPTNGGNVLITDASAQIHMNGAAINGTVTVTGGSTNVWQNGVKLV